MELVDAIRSVVEVLMPGRTVIGIETIAPDRAKRGDATAKAAGYGQPVRVRLDDGRSLVWRTAGTNDFGHDRRADRAAEMLLAYDDFARIPGHIRALDVGAIDQHGGLVSLATAGELYLLTTYAEGTLYADDLRRIATEEIARDVDLHRADALATYLGDLHGEPGQGSYRRAIRDLVGHGEGIYGIVDGFPDDVPGVPSTRLRAVEARCAEWRWKLRGRDARLTRTHGDFHPFNVVFQEGTAFTVLDASRGTAGDPADDVIAMAINYLFFALDHPRAWRNGLGPLWRRFWRAYGKARSDPDLLAVAPPFFAWRALVLANPRFYPALSERARDALLGVAERALDAGSFEPTSVEELFP